MSVRLTSITVTDGWYPNVGKFVTHMVAVDSRGRAWERWDGLGESNGWALIRSPEEPAKSNSRKRLERR